MDKVKKRMLKKYLLCKNINEMRKTDARAFVEFCTKKNVVVAAV